MGKKISKSEQRLRKIDYINYLKSDKWIKFRNKIKFDRGNKCEICSISGDITHLHGHHVTYVRFMNEIESDIQILCNLCHKEVHKTIKKNKTQRIIRVKPRKIKKKKANKIKKQSIVKLLIAKKRKPTKKKCRVPSKIFDMSLKDREEMRERNRLIYNQTNQCNPDLLK